MNDPKKWWLTNDQDVQTIKKNLTQALHALDSGLHKTDAVPDDWKRVTETTHPKFHEDYMGMYYYDKSCNEVIIDVETGYRLEAAVMIDVLLNLIKEILKVQSSEQKEVSP